MEAIRKNGQSLTVKYLAQATQIVQDTNILRIILRNLLSNSIKYSDIGQPIELKIELKGDEFVLTITDNGIGIPDDEQPYIFTRFYRSSNASNIQGTGLGLAIVERYVQVLGGKITFRSKEGEGSIFEINLPKKNGKAKEGFSD